MPEIGNTAGDDNAGRERPVVPARMLDKLEVATLFGCSPDHIDKMVGEGRMPPPVMLGTLARWSPTIIAGWQAAGCPPVRQ
jgi:predicted DNA-binding transcriptional regulator AlpA